MLFQKFICTLNKLYLQLAIVLTIISITHVAFGQSSPYYFNGSPVPRHVIEAYLSRGITAQNIFDNGTLSYNYLYDFTTFNNNFDPNFNAEIDFIKKIKPKYIHRADAYWGSDWVFCAGHHWENLKNFADYVHNNIDNDIILEAGLMEDLDGPSNMHSTLLTLDLNGTDSYLRTYFPSELSTAAYPSSTYLITPYDMVYQEVRDAVDNGYTIPSGYWYMPDMTQLSTRIWYFYRAKKYIDAGFESIHMGNLNNVLARDCNNYYITELVDAIRKYGSLRARRKVVFLNEAMYSYDKPEKECTSPANYLSEDFYKAMKDPYSYYNKSQVWYRGGTKSDLLWDWGSAGLDLSEDVQCPPNWSSINSQHDLVNVSILSHTDPLYVCEGQNSNPPYGLAPGGTHPQHWLCDHLPYFVEFDVSFSHNSLAPWQPDNWNSEYNMDDRTWFVNLLKDDKDYWLRYAWQRIRCIDNNAYLLLPGIFGNTRTFVGTAPNPVSWNPPLMYIANDVASTINDIWNNVHYNPELNAQFKNVNKRDGSTFPTFSWTDKLYVGDFNKDGKDDILTTANNDSGVGNTWQGYKLYMSNALGDDFIYAGNFTTTHPCGIPFSYLSWGEKFYVGDFDGDGYKNDIAVIPNKQLGITCPSGINFYKFNGTNFTFMYSLSWPSWSEKIYVGDFNKDGKDDLLVSANNDPGVNVNWSDFKILFNQYNTLTNAWSFSSPVNFNVLPQASWGEKFYIGDFDGDGYVNDFCTIANDELGINWQGLNMYQGYVDASGNVGFNYKGNLTCGAYCFPSWGEQLYVGDFNGDHKDDIIFTANNHVGINWQGYHVYVNRYDPATNNFSFADKGNNGCNDQCCFPSWGERFSIGDFNGDGYKDFLVTADKKLNIDWNGWQMYRSNGSSGSWRLSSNSTNISSTNIVNKDGISVYPIPFTSIINFKLPDGSKKANIYIYGIDGRVIKNEVTNKNNVISFDLSNYSNGLYIYEIWLDNKCERGKINKI